jgi:DNA repair exonuclease SbcCD nuclease subunit
MKILWSGDPHGKLSSLGTFQKYLAIMLELQESRKPEMVVIAGDLFDGHAIIRSEIMGEWAKYLTASKVPHILLVGNHDQIAPGAPVHAMLALKKYAKVVDGPYRLDNLLFFPYVRTQEEFAKMMSYWDGDEILFCHNTFDGAKYENGFYVPDAFSVELVKQLKLVVCGHIHSEQNFANIWYPGSPYSLTFADEGAEKSLYIIDTSNVGATVRIPTGLPKHETVKISVHDVLDWMEKNQSRTDDHFRLMISGSRAEITALADTSALKDLRKVLKLTFHPEYTDIAVKNEKISETSSPEDMIRTYVNKVMVTDLDKDRLLTLTDGLLKGNTV